MTEFLIPIVVLGLVLGGVILVNYLSSTTIDEAKKESCKVHDWAHDYNEKLVCCACGFRPENFQ